MRTRRSALLLLSGMLAVLACGAGDGPFVDSCALEGNIRVLANETNPFSALARVTVDSDIEVRVEYGVGEAFDRSTPTATLSAGQMTEFLVLGLRPDTQYDIRAVAIDGERSWTSSTQTFQTSPLPEGWPECTVTAPDPTLFDDNEVICSNHRLVDETPIYACVDRDGVPVWWLRHPDGERMQQITALPDGSFAAVGDSDSFVAFFDRYGEMTGEYIDLWFEGRTRFFHDWVDMHEVVELTEGPWAGAVAFTTATVDIVDGEERGGSGLIVFDRHTEEVVWDWHIHGEMGDGVSIDPDMIDYDRYGIHDEGGARYWNHGNALLHGIDDGGEFFWMSLRAQDWVIKIDVETDQVLWRLGYGGDFELVDDLDAADPEPLDPRRWFYQQHAPEWQAHDGDRARFLIYDNGVTRPDADGDPDSTDQYSRIVELEIDEDSRRATVHFEYGSPDEDDPAHFYSKQLGDADMLPGASSLMFDEGLGNPWIAEITYPGGQETWRYHCPDMPRFYRLNYFPSLYDTTWWYDIER
jgi:hypothetical protein